MPKRYNLSTLVVCLLGSAEAVGQSARAAADYARTVEHGLHYHFRGMTLLRLGDLYRDRLDDPARALAAYRRVGAQRSKIQHHTEAVTSAAALLIAQGEAEAALRELDGVDLREASRSRHCVDYLTVRARALATAGQRQAAIDAYRDALRLMEDRPGKRLALLVYGETWSPPRAFTEFPPNVMLRMRSPNAERRAAWQDYQVPGGFYASLGHLGTYGAWGYLPRQTPRAMTDLVTTLDTSGWNSPICACWSTWPIGTMPTGPPAPYQPTICCWTAWTRPTRSSTGC